jgi:hypothetical protein
MQYHIDAYTREKHRRKEHIGKHVGVFFEVLDVPRVAESYSRDERPGYARQAERLRSVRHKEAES